MFWIWFPNEKMTYILQLVGDGLSEGRGTAGQGSPVTRTLCASVQLTSKDELKAEWEMTKKQLTALGFMAQPGIFGGNVGTSQVLHQPMHTSGELLLMHRMEVSNIQHVHKSRPTFCKYRFSTSYFLASSFSVGYLRQMSKEVVVSPKPHRSPGGYKVTWEIPPLS